MGARLLYRDSRGQDGQVALAPETPCYVGRALDCAIRTDDAMVSRKHSMIRMENGAYYVEDLGSSNGTHVNNQRVSKHPLTHNDVVRCGSLLLRYVEDGPLVAPGPGRPAAAPGQPAAQIQYHKVVAQPVHLEEGQPGRMRMRHGGDIGRTDGFRQMG